MEILGIEQARSWNLATLNEFRAFFNLTKHDTFESINSDPEVADALRHLYEGPGLVELYPGLVVEEAKPSMAPGSGLCTDHTISRTILSDAVALVRGDRFYMVGTCSSQQSQGEIPAVCRQRKVAGGGKPLHFPPDTVFWSSLTDRRLEIPPIA